MLNITNSSHYDVIIIGGSYAGLSAALGLGRSLRKVLIIDGGMPCNRQTPHSHNFLTQDGEKPAAIAEKAKKEVLKYDTVTFLNAFALSGKKGENHFSILTDTGQEFRAKKLVFATGIKDIMPNIQGFAACWGISVVHCPYCHGYEFRQQKTAILANGKRGFHLASLVNNLSGDITLLTQGKADFSEEELEKLHQHGIPIIETSVIEMEHEQGRVKNVVFSDGSKIPFDVVYAALTFEQHSAIPVELGCELTEQGYIQVDAFQKTSVEGIYACGDNTNMMRSVANAVYSGNITMAVVNKELTDSSF